MSESNIIPFDTAKLPAAFRDSFDLDKYKDDLSGGVMPSFGVLSFRGKVWRLKHKGEEQILLNDAGEPRQSIEVVIIRANPALSRIYYAKAYDEGSDDPPDCFSLDGIKPDPSSRSKQSETCAACKWSVWGSKITPQNTKVKACADSRRLAVVPASDIKNEAYGGPMLLRIPPASLNEFDAFHTKLLSRGVGYYMFRVAIGFDMNVSYPKLVVRPLSLIQDETEAGIVLEFQNSDQVHRILSTAMEHASEAEPAAAPAEPAKEVATPAAQPEPATPVAPAAPAKAPVSTAFGSAPAQPVTPAPAAPTQAAPAEAPAPAQPTQEAAATIAESAAAEAPADLDNMLEDLLGSQPAAE